MVELPGRDHSAWGSYKEETVEAVERFVKEVNEEIEPDRILTRENLNLLVDRGPAGQEASRHHRPGGCPPPAPAALPN